MKRVLLTGARGFVGRQAIMPLINSGYEVHCVSAWPETNISPDLLFDNVFWHQTDLLDSQAVEALTKKVKATHLLHFAWYVEHGKFWTADENYLWVEASLKLLQEFHQCSGERAVISGTCAEYEWGKDDLLSETSTHLEPATIYGICKNNLRQKVFDFASHKDLKIAWGRIFFMYGQFEPAKRLVASVINSLLRDEFANCSHGNQIRDFLHVKDVAECFVDLLDSEVKGCFNVASGKSQTIKEFVLMIAKLIGKPEKVRFGALNSSANEPEKLVADVTKISNEVGWHPPDNQKERLNETINWWKGIV
jgi:nucleoside-diphosphate-sugar epimerase